MGAAGTANFGHVAALFNLVSSLVLVVVLAAIADAACECTLVGACFSTGNITPRLAHRRRVHVQELELPTLVAPQAVTLHGVYSSDG